MAKLTGFSNLKKTIINSTEKQFKARVKRFVDKVINLREKLLKAQQQRLQNRNINDGITSYPHRRTGNLIDNLIDIQMETYKETKYKRKGNILSYTHTTRNLLDGGANKSINTVFKTYKGKRYTYAQILQYSDTHKKYNGYFQRLQAIFRSQYYSSTSRLLRIT